MAPTGIPIPWYLGELGWSVDEPVAEGWIGGEVDCCVLEHMAEVLFVAEAGCELLMPLLPGRHMHAVVRLPGPLVTVGKVLTAVHSFYNEQPLNTEAIALVQAATDSDCWYNRDRVLAAHAAGKPVYWADVMRDKTWFDCLRVVAPSRCELVLTR